MFGSSCGQVVIEASDWHVAWPLSYRKRILPEDFQVTWTTSQTGSPLYRTAAVHTQSVLVQGCSNAEHMPQVQGDAGKLGLGSLIIRTLRASSLQARPESGADTFAFGVLCSGWRVQLPRSLAGAACPLGWRGGARN